jgi:hypothetical protein
MALLSVELAIWYEPARTAAATPSILDALSAVRRLIAADGPEIAILSCDGEPEDCA